MTALINSIAISHAMACYISKYFCIMSYHIFSHFMYIKSVLLLTENKTCLYCFLTYLTLCSLCRQFLLNVRLPCHSLLAVKSTPITIRARILWSAANPAFLRAVANSLKVEKESPKLDTQLNLKNYCMVKLYFVVQHIF